MNYGTISTIQISPMPITSSSSSLVTANIEGPISRLTTKTYLNRNNFYKILNNHIKAYENKLEATLKEKSIVSRSNLKVGAIAFFFLIFPCMAVFILLYNRFVIDRNSHNSVKIPPAAVLFYMFLTACGLGLGASGIATLVSYYKKQKAITQLENELKIWKEYINLYSENIENILSQEEFDKELLNFYQNFFESSEDIQITAIFQKKVLKKISFHQLQLLKEADKDIFQELFLRSMEEDQRIKYDFLCQTPYLTPTTLLKKLKDSTQLINLLKKDITFFRDVVGSLSPVTFIDKTINDLFKSIYKGSYFNSRPVNWPLMQSILRSSNTLEEVDLRKQSKFSVKINNYSKEYYVAHSLLKRVISKRKSLLLIDHSNEFNEHIIEIFIDLLRFNQIPNHHPFTLEILINLLKLTQKLENKWIEESVSIVLLKKLKNLDIQVILQAYQGDSYNFEEPHLTKFLEIIEGKINDLQGDTSFVILMDLYQNLIANELNTDIEMGNASQNPLENILEKYISKYWLKLKESSRKKYLEKYPTVLSYLIHKLKL